MRCNSLSKCVTYVNREINITVSYCLCHFAKGLHNQTRMSNVSYTVVLHTMWDITAIEVTTIVLKKFEYSPGNTYLKEFQ